MSKIIASKLQIREGPSTNTKSVGEYNVGEVINSGMLLIENEGRIWLKYKVLQEMTDMYVQLTKTVQNLLKWLQTFRVQEN